MTAATGAVAAAAIAMANAIKASGAIVRVEQEDFEIILGKINPADSIIVMTDASTLLIAKFKYLMPYKGLIFTTETSEEITIPADLELIVAKKFYIPT